MSESFVTRSDQGPVAVLRLERPERRNALSHALIDQLSDGLSEVGRDPAVRSVVITAAGSTFCAGMDLKEAANEGPDPEHETTAIAYAQALADLLQQVHALPKPTIAALNGDAFAGGAGLATACDFVIASPHVRIGYPEVRRGLVAAIVLHDLVRQVGDRRARYLLLTGEPITAELAESWGLTNRTVDAQSVLREALELGRSLVASAPVALATTKRLLDESHGSSSNPRGAAAISASVRVSDEAREGMLAFLEKRPPAWAPRSE